MLQSRVKIEFPCREEIPLSQRERPGEPPGIVDQTRDRPEAIRGEVAGRFRENPPGRTTAAVRIRDEGIRLVNSWPVEDRLLPAAGCAGQLTMELGIAGAEPKLMCPRTRKMWSAERYSGFDKTPVYRDVPLFPRNSTGIQDVSILP